MKNARCHAGQDPKLLKHALRVHIALVPLSVQILKPLDLRECLPFGDLLAGQAGVPARPAAEVDGKTRPAKDR